MNEVFNKLIVYFFTGTGNTYRASNWIKEVAEEKGIEATVFPFAKADPKAQFEAGPKTLL